MNEPHDNTPQDAAEAPPSRFYTLTPDGQIDLTHEGLAALHGIPVDEVTKVWPTLPRTDDGDVLLPAEWSRSGTRIRKELTARLGYEPGFQEALDLLEYLADTDTP